MVDDYLDVIAAADDEMTVYRQEISALRDRWQDAARRKRDALVDALRTLQDDLDDEAELPLIQVREHTRGLDYAYTETLTADGVIAMDRRCLSDHYADDYGVDTLMTWPHSNPNRHDDYDTPLTIEDYLSGDRDTGTYRDKLVDRLEAVNDGEDTVPSATLTYV